MLEFLLEHFPDFLFADENNEDKDARENVEHVEDVPHHVGSADCERDDFHRPRHAHQDEQTEDHTDPTKNTLTRVRIIENRNAQIDGSNIPLSGYVVLRLLIPEGQGRILTRLAELNGRHDEEGEIGQHNDGHRPVQV